jgi:hypothetical protein
LRLYFFKGIAQIPDTRPLHVIHFSITKSALWKST